MRDYLDEDEIFLLDKAIANPAKYLIKVDNDDVFVVDMEKDEFVDDFGLYGQDMIIALLNHIGASAETV